MFARYNKYLVAILLLFIVAGISPICFADSTITNPSSCPAALPAGTSATPYSYTFTGTGGNRWTIWTGTLPTGITLSRGGVLSGTTNNSGTYTFTVRYRATNGTSAMCTCTLTISSNITTPASCPANITTAVRGTGYTYTFVGRGGTGNPWSIISGALPSPLTLNAGTGVVSGTPAAADTLGVYNFTVRYNGTGGTYDTCDCTIVLQSLATTCTISGSGALSFGTLNGIDNAGGATATVTAPTITCTNGGRIYITDNGGMNEAVPGVQPARMSDVDGSDYIEYTFSYTSPLTGQGAVNIGPNLNLTGHIAAGKLDNTPAGPYNDTITLTISY